AVLERDRAASAERQATADRDRALRAEETARTEQALADEERTRVVQESKRADTEAATAKAVNDFLENDLLAQATARAQATPITKPDPNLTVRAALDRAALRIPGKFGSQPEVEASIRHTIGVAYRDLSLFAEAQTQLERALDLRRRALGSEHAETLDTIG